MGPLEDQLVGFLDQVQRAYRLEHAVLFGSRARGEALVDSDVDLLLVSPDFEGIAFLDRSPRLRPLWKSDLPLEIFCYTPGEFERKQAQIGLVADAIREGRELLAGRAPIRPRSRSSCDHVD